nr:DnaA regulatory inactivator Hda [Halochromatium glycolicum]
MRPPVPEARSRQLPLPLQQPAPQGLAGFIAQGNEPVIAAAKHWAQGSGEPYLYVHGAVASGKSHLLRCTADEAWRQGRQVVYLALDMKGLSPAVLDNLEHGDGVLLDALQARIGTDDWERALFNLYNRLRDRGTPLLIAARPPSGGLGVHLPDLASRLASGASFNLKPLDDEGRAALLRAGAAQRGLDLADSVVRYILSRCSRDPGSLIQLLDGIDAATLAEHRQPSIRSIGRLLEQIQHANAPDPDYRDHH